MNRRWAVGVVVTLVALGVTVATWDGITTILASTGSCDLEENFILQDLCVGDCSQDDECIATRARPWGCVPIPFVGRRCIGEQAAACDCAISLPD